MGSLRGTATTVRSKAEGEARDYCAGIASEVSSSFPAGDAGMAEGKGGEWREAGEADLELGLSLGAAKAVASGRKAGGGGGDPPWREYCRILTARDFPSMMASRGSPISSSSSSASSCPSPGGGERGRAGAGVAGSKRAGEPVSPRDMGYRSPSQVVGWPPIRAYRMNSLMIHSRDNLEDNNSNNGRHEKDATVQPAKVHNNGVEEDAAIAKEHEKKRLVGASLFVKVNMDGVPIGRKVDLSAHRAYETLALVLEDMFQKPSSINNPLRSAKTSKLLDGSSEFVLTYEDKDGDWLLAGDVPWRMFLSTVKRLRIMRTSDANGLAPRFQASRIGIRS